MKKILFPTDFSEISKNAYLFALHLAKSINAEIITLHTYDFPQVNYMDVPIFLPDIYEVTELCNFKNYEGHIPALRSIAAKHHLEHIKVSNVLESGDLIECILKISKNEKIDYIVMGTQGASGMTANFLGSVTEKVINETQAVVLAIPENCEYKPIKRVLFVTDYKTEEIEMLKKTLVLAKIFGSHVDCLYVKPSQHFVAGVIMEDWEKLFHKQQVTFHNLTGSDAEGTILEFIEKHNIDMLAMTTHHHTFFERIFQVSLSKKLAFHVKIPILALHVAP